MVMDRLVNSFHSAKHVLFVTGAGISVASGLPTYRGIGGLYENNFIPPSIRMSEAVFNWFPRLTWSHLHKVFKASKDVKPNAAHTQIAKIAKFIPRVTVLTQNVDGLHQEAGSRNVIEIHGNARSLVCTHCGWKDEHPDFANLPSLPRCAQCKSVVRPPVVLFGGNLPEDELDRLEENYSIEPDIVVGIGTTALFPYILEPFERANTLGKTTVVIDPTPSEHMASMCEYVITEPAEKFLPEFFKKVVKTYSGIPKDKFQDTTNITDFT